MIDRKSIMVRAWELARSAAADADQMWHNANAHKVKYATKLAPAPVFTAAKVCSFLRFALRRAWQEAKASPESADVIEARRQLWGAECSDLRGSLRDQVIAARRADVAAAIQMGA